MFDIKPVEKTDGFDLKSNFEKEEISLVDFLMEEESKILSENQIKDERRQALRQKIKEEAGSFNNLSLDQYFSEENLPTKIILKPEKKLTENFEQINLNNRKKKLIEKISSLEFELKSKKREKIQLQEEISEIDYNRSLNRQKSEKVLNFLNDIEENLISIKKTIHFKSREIVNLRKTEKAKNREAKLNKIKQNLLAKPFEANSGVSFLRPFLSFSGAGIAIFMIIFSARFFSYGFQVKDEVKVKGISVVKDLEKIKSNFQDKNFSQLISDFEKMQTDINKINQDLEVVEGGLPAFVNKLPFISKYSSAKNLLEAGEEISKALIIVSELGEEFSDLENPLNSSKENQKVSLGNFFLNLEDQTQKIEEYLEIANDKIKGVDIEDLPIEYQKEAQVLKEKFPQILFFANQFNQKQAIFKDLLGYHGPRKYLVLFQNNHEIRATGGFVGSYGILSVHDGNIDEFFIDGIFNPDGQLYTKVIPPKPIQKISTAWSTHDANWFPNFPDSAEKIAWFYEKTGGATVDGIITVTPTVLEKLLEFVGPIEMEEYQVTIDSDNFMKLIQKEVEVDYDKEDNKPKQVLADLAPKIFEKLFSSESLSDFPQLLSILSESLEEKHILINSENSDIQKIVSDLGWSGEVLETPKDYLMVVNSNINGYKTDGVIDQKIEHQIEIQPDGSIFDTVTIERIHNGGSLEYDWWNKVNANYMRVYVPLGSELMEASGYTREVVEPPVNYDKLGFVSDDLVSKLEDSIEIDQETGTEIWEENGKTVFGNWVYVSPQEKVKVVYKYKLPFKVLPNKEIEKMDNYSVLYQKQSGINTSVLNSELILNSDQEIFWQYPETIQERNNLLEYNTNLEKDRFMGVVIK